MDKIIKPHGTSCCLHDPRTQNLNLTSSTSSGLQVLPQKVFGPLKPTTVPPAEEVFGALGISFVHSAPVSGQNVNIELLGVGGKCMWSRV